MDQGNEVFFGSYRSKWSQLESIAVKFHCFYDYVRGAIEFDVMVKFKNRHYDLIPVTGYLQFAKIPVSYFARFTPS